MLPEAGATELIFLAAIALIVVGPKDLPVLMRKVGQWIAKMRNLASEFRSSFDELARQSELDELRKEVEALRQAQDKLNLETELSAIDPANYPGYGYDPHPAEAVPHPEPTTVEAIPEAAPAKKPRAPRKPKAEVAAAEPADEAEAKPARKPRARRAAAES